MTVSVHVVTYNSSATIEACLGALLAQQGAGFTPYIIDNASGDDTVARVERMGLEVHRNAANVGFAAAHNQAIDATSSQYVLALNPDVLLQPGFIARMAEALDAHPEAGSAAGQLLRVDRLGDPPQVIDSTGLIMSRSRRQRLRDEGLSPGQARQDITPIFGPDGAAAFYRRAMLDDIRVDGEVFDRDFFMHKEDIDVCWRAQLRGWASIYVPGAVAHHVRSFRPGQRGRVSAEMRFYGVRNRYLLMMKNEIAAHFWRDLPSILAYDLAILAYMLLFEQRSLAALNSAWKLRRRMAEKRQLIQAGRTATWRVLRQWFP